MGKKTGLYSPELLDCSPVWSEKKLDWTVVMHIYIFLTSQIVERNFIIIPYSTPNISFIVLNNPPYFSKYANILIYNSGINYHV
jgi:hypothetical protein